MDPFIPPSDWANRFAYCEWLLHFRLAYMPKDTDMAKEADVPASTFASWRGVANIPREPDRVVRVAEMFGLGADDMWLLAGRGEPPEPELWEIWNRERQRQARLARTRRDEFRRELNRPLDGDDEGEEDSRREQKGR